MVEKFWDAPGMSDNTSSDDRVDFTYTPASPPLELLIAQLGKQGYHVMVRYDPHRESKKWTVLIGFGFLTERMDVDEPAPILASWLTHAGNVCQE